MREGPRKYQNKRILSKASLIGRNGSVGIKRDLNSNALLFPVPHCEVYKCQDFHYDKLSGVRDPCTQQKGPVGERDDTHRCVGQSPNPRPERCWVEGAPQDHFLCLGTSRRDSALRVKAGEAWGTLGRVCQQWAKSVPNRGHD